MVAVDCLKQTGMMFANYSLSNKIRENELDGRQQLTIGILASTRMNLLITQWQIIRPGLKTYGASLIPLGIGVITSVASPVAEKYLEKPKSERNQITTNLCKLTVKAGKAGHFASKHINTVLEVASAVSFVAMICLGFPVPGIFGLVGLLLIAIKRSGYLPKPVDRILAPVVFLSEVIVNLTMPINIVLKVIVVLLDLSHLILLINKYQGVRKYLPEKLRNPMPGQHIIKGSDKIENNNIDSIVSKTCGNYNFEVNFTSIYAKEVGSLLPVDFEKDLEKKTAKDFFQEIDDRMTNDGVVFSEDEQDGYAKLKKGVIKGQFGDTTPPNLEIFRKIMKAQLQSILNDDNNFAEKIADLALIGNSCSEGWLREVLFLLHPDTKNAAWGVHHELAILRGEIAKELVRELDDDLKEVVKIKGFDLSALGGENNVHLNNAFQAGIWHRFRTYEGELHQEVYSKSLIGALLLNSLKMDKNRDEGVGIKELIIFASRMLKVNFSALLYIFEFVKKFKKLDDCYQVDNVVDNIYDAIKPQYLAATGDAGALDNSRKIQWEAVQSWVADISSRKDDIEFYDANGWSEKWIAKDENDQPYLTKKGVRLLLWDLGVLTSA